MVLSLASWVSLVLWELHVLSCAPQKAQVPFGSACAWAPKWVHVLEKKDKVIEEGIFKAMCGIVSSASTSLAPGSVQGHRVDEM